MFDNETENDKSSRFDALCVKLYDEGKIGSVSADGSRDISYLTDIVVDILSEKLDDKQQTMASELLMDLVKKAENDLKKSLAFRLADMEGLPFDLILFLANEDVEISRPILEKSPCFSEMDLLYFIHAHDSDYWKIIAQRENLSEKAIVTLAEKRDVPTSCRLLKNKMIEMPKTAMEIFCELTEKDAMLADLIAERPEACKEIVSSIYEKVSAHLRSEISRKFDISNEKINEAIKEATQEYVDAVYGDYMVTRDMHMIAEKLRNSNNLNRSKIMQALTEGHIGTFMAFLSMYAKVDVQTVYGSLCQPSGQSLAVIARAGDFTKNEFMTMFAVTKGMRLSQNDDSGITGLNSALNYYDRITKEMADRLIKKPLS